MMPIDDWNRMAVQGLLADADRILALTDLEAVRGDREIVDDAIANAQKNYIDLVRRRRPLMLAGRCVRTTRLPRTALPPSNC
jgi:hypothetical protein